MTIGGSLLLIAIGAILKFAVTATVSGIDLGTVGIVLMGIGIVAFLIAIAFLISSRRRSGPGTTTGYREDVVERRTYDDRYDDGRPPL